MIYLTTSNFANVKEGGESRKEGDVACECLEGGAKLKIARVAVENSASLPRHSGHLFLCLRQ